VQGGVVDVGGTIAIRISGLVPAELQSGAQGVFQGATGFAVLSAVLLAGLLWGSRGQLPLLISGIAGDFFCGHPAHCLDRCVDPR
jgi:hypothetical protein